MINLQQCGTEETDMRMRTQAAPAQIASPQTLQNGIKRGSRRPLEAKPKHRVQYKVACVLQRRCKKLISIYERDCQ